MIDYRWWCRPAWSGHNWSVVPLINKVLIHHLVLFIFNLLWLIIDSFLRIVNRSRVMLRNTTAENPINVGLKTSTEGYFVSESWYFLKKIFLQIKKMENTYFFRWLLHMIFRANMRVCVWFQDYWNPRSTVPRVRFLAVLPTLLSHVAAFNFTINYFILHIWQTKPPQIIILSIIEL